MEKFKDRFYNLRTEMGLNQRDMAEKLGVSQGTVAMWELGHRTPTVRKYEELADFFNVDLDYLLCKQDVKKRVDLDPLEAGAQAAELIKNQTVLTYAYRILALSPQSQEHIFNTIDFLTKQDALRKNK